MMMCDVFCVEVVSAVVFVDLEVCVVVLVPRVVWFVVGVSGEYCCVLLGLVGVFGVGKSIFVWFFVEAFYEVGIVVVLVLMDGFYFV